MRILIIGASGLVGGNCLSYLSPKENYEVKGTWFSFPTEGTFYFNTLDMQDDSNKIVLDFAPEIIIHTGALTHVDYCEEHPEESYLKTVVSTQNVVQLCKTLNAKLIYISSDYVFDGQHGPYRENAPANPLNIYGKHKLEAEQYISTHIDNYLILRVTNVYGDEKRGKNFVSRFIQNCKTNDDEEFHLPLDQFATPINARDIARAIELLIIQKLNGLYHLSSTDYLSRVQLALKIMQYYPVNKIKISPTHTSELHQPALRPLFGGLQSGKFLEAFPTFEFQSLDNYLLNRIESQKENYPLSGNKITHS